MDKKQLIKYVGLGLVIAGALFFIFRNVAAETGPREWFYDLSEGSLYTAPLGSIPPLGGVGGAGGDGVQAIVIAPEGRCADDAARKIAYLQTYTDEYKRLKQEATETGVANETSERAFQASNTLIKRVDDAEWVGASTPEGEAIIMEFNELMQPSPDRERWRPCKPGQ